MPVLRDGEVALESCSAYRSAWDIFKWEIGLPDFVSADEEGDFWDFLDCLDDDEFTFIVINNKYVLFCDSFGNVETVQDIGEFCVETEKFWEESRNETESD